MIFLALSRWDVIREQFTEDEKDRLNAAIAGETICPRGATLDPGKLGQELTGKLTAAIEGKKEGGSLDALQRTQKPGQGRRSRPDT